MKRSVLGFVAAALFLSAPGLRAQLALEWSGGVLGSGVTFGVSGPAGEKFVLLPSTQGGPTLLGNLFPGDPRKLLVGLESKAFWRLGTLSGGVDEVTYPFPADPSASGLPLYAQAITFPGTTFFVGEISNPVSFAVSLEGENHPTLDMALEARREHTATALQDGRVLLAGGRLPASISPSWELFDSQRQSYGGGSGLLPERRFRHTASLLQNGRVLLVGGADAAGNALGSTVLFDPVTLQAVSAAPLPLGPRVHHTATLLSDGRVLVVGGATRTSQGNTFGYPLSFQFGASTTLEIYDPVGNAWTSGPSLSFPRVGHRSALLPDGRVLIAGGVLLSASPQTVPTALVYDPLLGSLTPTPPMPAPLAFHQTVETLAGGVLVAGGSDIDPLMPSAVGSVDSYLYELPAMAHPSTATWSSLPDVPAIIQNGEIRCIPAGCFPGFPNPFKWEVLYFLSGGYGGVDFLAGTQTPSDRMIDLDATFATWTDRGNMLRIRAGGRSTVLDLGARVFFSGAGQDAFGMPDLHGEIRVRGD